MTAAKIRVAVTGVGYWGINHARVFASLRECEVTWLCDVHQDNLTRATRFAPDAKTTASFDDILCADNVDAVVLATPAPSHHAMAISALSAGKHILVEKPVALSRAQAEEIQAAVATHNRVLAVGHLMLHHPALQEIKRLIEIGELGDVFYLHSTRVNLGRLRHDENALWSFGPHDLSMIDYLLGAAPVSVSARGACYLQDKIEDVVFVNLRYARGQVANIHLSWLNPRKERRLTVVGSKKMVEFDDVSAEKLRIYDKGYEKPPAFKDFSEYLTIRQGGIHIPHIPMREPLVDEARDFLHCIRDDRAPVAGINSAVRLVAVLEAAQASLDLDGEPVQLDPIQKN